MKTGDRIRVYYIRGAVALDYIATVIEVLDGGTMVVQSINGGSHVRVHPKQCRKLKPKPRVWWIYGRKLEAAARYAHAVRTVSPCDLTDWVCVREVKKK